MEVVNFYYPSTTRLPLKTTMVAIRKALETSRFLYQLQESYDKDELLQFQFTSTVRRNVHEIVRLYWLICCMEKVDICSSLLCIFFEVIYNNLYFCQNYNNIHGIKKKSAFLIILILKEPRCCCPWYTDILSDIKEGDELGYNMMFMLVGKTKIVLFLSFCFFFLPSKSRTPSETQLQTKKVRKDGCVLHVQLATNTITFLLFQQINNEKKALSLRMIVTGYQVGYGILLTIKS